MLGVRPYVRDYRPGSVMDRHEHDRPSITLVVHGGFDEQIGRQTRAYSRGQIAYFPAETAHSQRFGALGARQITFHPPGFWVDYLADCRIALGDAPHANSAASRAIGDRLLREIGRDDSLSALACEGLLLEAVAVLGRASRAHGPVGPVPAWLRAAHDYIREQACGPVTLAEIASAAGRHEIHLAREFRRHYGMSIGCCLRRLRVEHAARLLRGSNQSLTEIALESGFSSHAHLCREFKAQLGLTPSHYRERGL